MARRCDVTGKGVLTGNNVSHAHNKTRRRYLPNIQKMTLFSETLGSVRMKVTPGTLRTIEHKGGLDTYLLNTSSRLLTEKAKKLRNRIKKTQAKSPA